VGRWLAKVPGSIVAARRFLPPHARHTGSAVRDRMSVGSIARSMQERKYSAGRVNCERGGALVATTLTRTLSPEALLAWGSRLPFVFGLLIGPLGFYLRRHIDDTLPAASSVKPARLAERMPLRQIVAGTMIVIGASSTMYTIVFFLPSFLTMTIGMPSAVSLLAGCTAGLVLLVGSPFAGRLADRMRRRKTLLYVASIVSLGAILPAFHAIQVWPSIYTVMLVVSVLIGAVTLSSPVAFVLILEAFRPEVRATSLGIIYALGVTIFGGFAQFIVSGLWRMSGSF
jgi:MFS transporter, MHS family, proline/betaine transporter